VIIFSTPGWTTVVHPDGGVHYIRVYPEYIPGCMKQYPDNKKSEESRFTFFARFIL